MSKSAEQTFSQAQSATSNSKLQTARVDSSPMQKTQKSPIFTLERASSETTVTTARMSTSGVNNSLYQDASTTSKKPSEKTYMETAMGSTTSRPITYTGTAYATSQTASMATPSNLASGISTSEPQTSTQYTWDRLRLNDTDFSSLQNAVKDRINDANMQTSLEWIRANRYDLDADYIAAGEHLDVLIGKEYVSVPTALKSIDILIGHGFLTAREVTMSEDAHTLAMADADDHLSMHSLANVIRKILKQRRQDSATPSQYTM